MPLTPGEPRIHYTEHGTSGTPVLLVMGFGMSGAAWEPQVGTLAKHHRVATFDNRGIGQSESSRALWTVADMADDSLRVLEALGWERAHLVGVSMGGLIARQLATSQPHRWDSLTLIAAHAGGLHRMVPHPATLKRFADAQAGDPRDRVRALKRLLFPPAWLADNDGPALDARLANRVGTVAPRKTLVSQFHAVVRHGPVRGLSRIRQPTLVVKPCADELVPPHNSDRLAERIPDARLVEFPDGGHGVTFQHADALNARLLEHFARVDATRT